MQSYNSRIYKVVFAALILFASAIFCFAEQELAPLDFVGASDENPDVQSVALRVSPDARVEVSDPKLISAGIKFEGESTRLEVAVNTVGREASEEGTQYEGRVVISDAQVYIIWIRIIIFPSTPKECRGKRVKVEYLTRGSFDNFAGVEPTFPSPYLISTGLLQRRYDEPGANLRYFGDSYALGNCKVCGVRVFVRARGEGEIDYNDSIDFGVSDAGNGTNYNSVSLGLGFTNIWTPLPSFTPHTFWRDIPGSALNPEIFAKNAPRLDITSQDDTAIDYTQVYIYRY